ncbi:hypothetical protein C7S18_19325 [Ahniella affigens]|uniref:SUF system FeS cluster assembly SufBD core domain-containing protein n=1 Tax=Ahniella affigens TaxID=2021234 RepID=A0A2P1PWE9_9GAMM|nr:SufD family Fe-S cluster assembly protein [Ahniella affigens]AVP99185.1 hypothetical protein C7S18_19325 [Ahniella affigens]
MSDLLTAMLSQVGEAGDVARSAARAKLRAKGLPTNRDERWRYTPLRSLLARALASNASEHEAEFELPEWLDDELADLAPDVLYIDGQLAELSDDEDADAADGFEDEGLFEDDLPELAAEISADAHWTPYTQLHADYLDDGFELANMAMNDGGTLWVAEPGDGEPTEEVLRIAYANTATNQGWRHLRHRIRVGKGQSLLLIEEFLSDPASNQGLNLGHEIELEAGARLNWVRVGDIGDHNHLLGFARLRVGAGATLGLYEINRGAGVYRQFTQVDLAGPKAHCHAAAVIDLDGRRHADVQWQIDHRARDTSANLVARGLARGRSKLAVAGSLMVHAGADGTDTRFSSKNLLLSEHAEVNTKPVLEIDADEVKAAHGATVGQLDERALFYLRARGLPLAEAQQMLTHAFAFEAFADLRDAELKQQLQAVLEEQLGVAP